MGSWPVPPTDTPGLMQTPFIGVSDAGRIAAWVGIGEQVLFDPEFDVDFSTSMILDAAFEDINFALGFVDTPPTFPFTTDDGTKVRIGITWSPPAARSTTPIKDRLREGFGDTSKPLATMYGVASKGMKLWTLCCTKNAIYALSESGLEPIVIDWADLTEIRWNGLDLSLGVMGPDEATYTRLHEFFQLRNTDAWEPFATALEQAWDSARPPVIITKDLGKDGVLHGHVHVVHERLFPLRMPFGDRPIYKAACDKGLKSDIDAWFQSETSAIVNRYLNK